MPGKDWYLKIASFGGFSVRAYSHADENPIGPALPGKKTWSRKVWYLVKYLLFSETKTATVSELVDHIWPRESSVADPVRSLRLLVYRARQELDKLGCVKGSDLIVAGDGSYRWNRAVPAEIDADVFKRCYRDSRSGGDASRLPLLEKAIRLYGGPFLPEEASAPWVMVLDTYYHSKYTAMCLEAAAIDQRLGRPWDILDLCGRALIMDPYEDGLHTAMIRALAEVGAVKEAKKHYLATAEMYRNSLDVSPGREMTEAYEAVLKNEDTKSADAVSIQADLDQVCASGAFYCEYDAFKRLYCLKREECSRGGIQVQLSLITLFPAAGHPPDDGRQKKIMLRMKEIIAASLRKGDIFSRYSATQYILLLQFTSAENGVFPLNRIQRNYQKDLPKSGYLLQCKILPIGS